MLDQGIAVIKIIINSPDVFKICTVNLLWNINWLQKEEISLFLPPFPPCNIVPMFELPTENNKHPKFEWRGRGGRRIPLLSEVTLFEYDVSTILLLIVS